MHIRRKPPLASGRRSEGKSAGKSWRSTKGNFGESEVWAAEHGYKIGQRARRSRLDVQESKWGILRERDIGHG